MLQIVLSKRKGDVEAARARRPTTARWGMATLAQLAVAVYGGYFGAGIGILMLVVLGFLGLTDIHAMNGLEELFGITINVVAAAWFVLHGAVLRPIALVMIGERRSAVTPGALWPGASARRRARGRRRHRPRRSPPSSCSSGADAERPGPFLLRGRGGHGRRCRTRRASSRRRAPRRLASSPRPSGRRPARTSALSEAKSGATSRGPPCRRAGRRRGASPVPPRARRTSGLQ
ncbi:MAG: sulfite exporter TauE/SafE family protein [Holophagales bacterium]|nr:sulfite exporter TauE/SafE family protein [Holophagales bacterium]